MAAIHSPRSLMPVCAAAAVLLASCASTRLDAQWSDQQLTPGSLRGARVMVACEAYDLVRQADLPGPDGRRGQGARRHAGDGTQHHQ